MKWSNASPLRIAMLDDHPLIRSGVSTRLAQESDLKLVAAYAGSREMLAGLREASVDLLILDYTLQQGELDGLNLIKLLRIRHPAVRILVSSSAEAVATMSLAMRAGVKGFVGKSQDINELVAAIRVVASERIYLPPAVTLELGFVPAEQAGDVIGSEGETSDSALSESPMLTPREQEVLRCCLDGMSVSGIAAKFTRSRKTISGQKQSAFRKLGIRCDTELFKIQDQLRAG
ncbi:response regulator transcription factor [Pseudomonas fluorescens]|uniref:response regulator transcription factor n=1 Tax=Pseudomonas fluorescens TaxID=294 RepID=UPI001A9DEBBE|nr:response regulator transcription factor [Pseudomonas fluorescens]QTD31479.1 response regulator transcription factor [Pseudomonas fluorescens]